MSTIDSQNTLLGAGVMKRSTRLADDRELIYYDDPATTLGPDRAVDARILDPRPATASMRYDVLTGDWISVASARQNRVFLPPAELDPLAPQTLTNPSEVPSQYDVAIFENRSPSFGPALPASGTSTLPVHPGPGTSYPSHGRCEVVCFSPEHEGSFGSLSPVRARTVIEAWADRTTVLSSMPGVAQVFPFENRGEEIGVTLPHPHGQIYAYPFITPRTRRLLHQVEEQGTDLFTRVLDTELTSGRVVLSGKHWTAFVPFAARWPVEVQILPHRHIPDLAATSEDERDELAPFYLRLLRGVDEMYDAPTPYIAAWHQAPTEQALSGQAEDRRLRDAIRLRLELTSPRRAADKLKYLAGSESAMGAWIADIPPETAADRLRDAIARADVENPVGPAWAQNSRPSSSAAASRAEEH